MKKILPLLFLVIFLSLLVGGCAEFLDDYTYGAGGQNLSSSDTATGTPDPFKDYGAYGPTSAY